LTTPPSRMSPVAAQTAVFSPTHAVSRVSIRTWIAEHVVVLNIVSLVVVALMVVAYIIQVNASISQGYQIRELETQLNELSLMNQNLELATRKSQSLDHVAQSVKMLGFVEAEMPNYISGSEPAFAMAE
jgi:cell division protein FtsL